MADHTVELTRPGADIDARRRPEYGGGQIIQSLPVVFRDMVNFMTNLWNP